MATSDPGRAFESDRRLLQTLERVLTIDELDLHGALSTACTLVADALAADKADVFLYEANDGVAVAVFRKGERYHAGEADKDPEQLRGMVEALAVRSEIAVQLEVRGQRRGVPSGVSQGSELFTVADVQFLAAVAGWIGIVTHRAELVEQATRDAAAAGGLKPRTSWPG